MEASALAEASRRGLLARSSPLLRLASDERLVELIREHHERAFEVLFERYQPRLLAFCRNMLPSEQDAEDILQDVFMAAHQAMIADDRALKVRPWLYRIARNRCLNHLRRQTADGQDSMDEYVHSNGASTAQQVENREEFRELLRDVRTLPETQRTALLLREIEGLSYMEIAQSMGTTVPAVKSLLVRARVTLADSSQARQLTCGEVRLQLAEAAEGLRKVEGPVRQHIRRCDECHAFREQLQDDSRALDAIFPLGPLVLLKGFLLSKLGIGGSGAATAGGGTASVGGAATAGAAAAGGGAAMAGGTAGGGAIGTALGGLGIGGMGGAVGGAIGAKAAAGVATAALLTAGAVEVKSLTGAEHAHRPAAQERSALEPQGESARAARLAPGTAPSGAIAAPPPEEAQHEPPVAPIEDATPLVTVQPEDETATGATAAPEAGAIGPPAEEGGLLQPIPEGSGGSKPGTTTTSGGGTTGTGTTTQPGSGTSSGSGTGTSTTGPSATGTSSGSSTSSSGATQPSSSGEGEPAGQTQGSGS